MNGLRVFGVPTAGRFLARYGLIPVTIPWDNVEVAMQTGELDGVAWCGFTEAYEVGWADVCNYALTNSVTGAWFGSYFANTASWEKVPPHLRELFLITIDQSHYYRNVWYWGGEAKLRVEGDKMELTSLPPEEWAQVLADSKGFWMKWRPRRRARPGWWRRSTNTPRPWTRRAIPTAERRGPRRSWRGPSHPAVAVQPAALRASARSSCRNASRASWTEAITRPVGSPSPSSAASDSCRLASMVSGTATLTPAA